ncbi:uncharacterized protein LOC144563643 [Carex rostrata]
MAYNEEDYTFRLPKDLATVPVYKLISCLSWSTTQSDFDHVASFLSDRHDALQSQLAKLKSSYAQLQQENSLLKASRDQLESSNAMLKQDNSSLESKCGILVQENTNLSSQLDSLKTSYMQLEPVKLRCGVLKNELEKLKSDLESVKSSYMQAAKAKSPVKSTCSQLHQENSEEKSITLENDRKITESMIRKIFSPYGEIVEIELIKDQSSMAKGLCFVRYSKRESALDVKRQKNKVEMRGKKIGLDLSLDQNDLFFGNLKKEWSSEQVDQLIRQTFRGVVSVELAMAPVPEFLFGLKRCSNRGFAFVHFSSHEAAAHAHHVGSNPDFMLGGVLRPLIEWALPQADFDLAEMAKTKVAFVGNLPPAAHEEYLQKLFGPIGNVEKITISRKSFAVAGYVHFATRTDLERAIEEMNGRTVGAPDRGPPFKIKVAVAKTPAKGPVCPRDGVIKARIKPLDVSNKRRDYSLEAPVSKVQRLDSMETAIASLSPLVKERLLTVLRLRIATEHDIDLNCLNGLKELPEACAISVLDQFLFSGADKYDKKSFLASLIAEKRGSWSTSTSSPCQSDYSLRVPPNEERHHNTHSPRSSFSPVPVASRRIRYDPRPGQGYKFSPYYS